MLKPLQPITWILGGQLGSRQLIGSLEIQLHEFDDEWEVWRPP